MIVEETFDSGEVSLNVARFPGGGPPLLLLHGVLRRWSDFSPLLPLLTQRWQVFGLDFRGHGESGFMTGNYRVADYARDAIAVVRDLLTEPAVIYGHSLGAMVAAAVAAEAPEKVRAVILEDPPFHTMGDRIQQTPFHSQFTGYEEILDFDVEKSVERLAADLAEVRVTNPATGTSQRLGDLRDGAAIRFMASCLTQVDPDVLTPIIAGEWLSGYDWEGVAKRITCPALLLQADEAAGGMLTPEDAARFASLAANCVTVRFPGAGHLLHWSAMEATCRTVGTFLESLR